MDDQRLVFHAERAKLRATTDVPVVFDARGEDKRYQSDKIMMRDSAFSPGYLGCTSYTSVFRGARDSLTTPEPSPEFLGEDAANSEDDDVGLRSLPLPTQQMCLVALQHLPGQPNAHMVFHDQPGPETTTSWTHVAVSRIVSSLRDLFERFGGSESSEEKVASVLCRNTARPMQDTFDNADDWMDQFCGPNIRWESIGLLWAHLEGISDALSTLQYRQLQWAPGKESTSTSLNHLHYCIEIVRQFTPGNDLLLDLCRRQALLGTLVYGDASSGFWNSDSLCVSMMLFLGNHAPPIARRPQISSEKPSFCAENKRRIFASIFSDDKKLVSFTGRPPLLSRRYCSSPMPLDLPDESLVANNATLAEYVKALDPRGWNTQGNVYPVSLIRARCMMAQAFDAVIEVALGHDSHVSLDYLQSLKAEVTQTFIKLPSCLIFDYHVLDDPDLDTNIVYARISLYLAHRRDIFVIERLLLQHGAIDDGSLLATSFDLVKVTVLLWVHKNRFAPMKRNFEWLLMAYAAPGGGILCQELLRPTFFGVHPLNPSLSRSSIVQQLSLLVAFLTWIGPSSPNRVMCTDCKAVIQRVLDQHLNTTASSASLKPLGPGFPRSLDFRFDLLNTFEWLQDD
ncbi:hypothetical protein F66182_5702 [Fusarium sp. NRRL 66182]|nr:hypothetical protein F66182_5702 [Fusarium sp. NRRL 66182]